MAKILGFTYGELRGKIGGTVFSRNKAGAYARAKVTPVNPQTIRQQSARYRFGNASIIFQSLLPGVKSCWEVFARTHFNPLKGNSSGIYTGGNAFVALKQSTSQGNEYRVTPIGISGAAAQTFSSVPYTNITEPPDFPSSSTIVDNLGVAHPFEINSIQVSKQGTIAYNVAFPDVLAGDARTFTSFQNGEGQNFGISFYLSNNLKFVGARPNTILKVNVSDSGVITDIGATTGGAPPTLGAGLNITQPFTGSESSIKDFPCAGDICMVTPFVRTSDGAQKKMEPQYVTVIEEIA